jgi:KUP system potassium uptake protein
MAFSTQPHKEAKSETHPASKVAHHSNGSRQKHTHPLSVAGVLITMGIIFGDIGTSPLYVIKAIIDKEQVSETLVYGGVSCVFWTLMLVTTLKYVYLALNADNRGEGGIFALYALVRRYKAKWVVYPAIIGCAALIADGFITPPISVASAVEGLRLLPGYEHIPTVPIVCGILVALFMFQQFGTSVVGATFGPIMLVWFSVIGTLGVIQIMQYPQILRAVNPAYALQLITNYRGHVTGLHGFWLLGAVFLCTTGGEALYSDLGHCGKRNIRVSWSFVWVALLLSYFGQSAWVMLHHNGTVLPEKVLATGIFYQQIQPQYLPYLLALATAAAVIASQALISGCFTLVNEAMKLKLWINMKVNYPTQLQGQIYIPTINWFLLGGCLLVVLIFRESSNMDAAYGLAIIFNMLMTTTLLLHYLHVRDIRNNSWQKNAKIYAIGILFITIELAFLVSNLSKFTHGGWFSVMIAVILFSAILALYLAKKLRTRHISFVPIHDYVPMLQDLMLDESIPKESTNLVYMCMADNEQQIDSNIIYSIFRKRPKRADIYWFVHVVICDDPYEQKYKVHTVVPGKVFFIRLKFGFKVDHKVNLMFSNIVKELQENGEVDEVSHYPSLRKYAMPADFKFIILNSRVSVDDEISTLNQIIIRAYRVIKKLALPTADNFGLEMANVEVETVPISVAKAREIKLRREL